MLILLCFFVVFPALISKGPPSAWRWHLSVLGGILVPMFNYNLLGGPLFEEFGWRGFLQSRLQDVLPPWIAAICVGVMWAAWHLPLFLVQGWSSASPVTYPVILIGLSMVMAFGFNASEEAIGAAILMHSAFNSSPRFVGAYLNGGSMREHPTAVWLIAASFLLAGIMLVIITRGRLAASQTTDR
jgi:membrane protease YdiL (CAAX protease family)